MWPGSRGASAAVTQSQLRAPFAPASLLGPTSGPLQLSAAGTRTFGAWRDGPRGRGVRYPRGPRPAGVARADRGAVTGGATPAGVRASGWIRRSSGPVMNVVASATTASSL